MSEKNIGAILTIEDTVLKAFCLREIMLGKIVLKAINPQESLCSCTMEMDCVVTVSPSDNRVPYGIDEYQKRVRHLENNIVTELFLIAMW
jgi:hypothetical protein